MRWTQPATEIHGTDLSGPPITRDGGPQRGQRKGRILPGHGVQLRRGRRLLPAEPQENDSAGNRHGRRQGYAMETHHRRHPRAGSRRRRATSDGRPPTKEEKALPDEEEGSIPARAEEEENYAPPPFVSRRRDRPHDAISWELLGRGWRPFRARCDLKSLPVEWRGGDHLGLRRCWLRPQGRRPSAWPRIQREEKTKEKETADNVTKEKEGEGEGGQPIATAQKGAAHRATAREEWPGAPTLQPSRSRSRSRRRRRQQEQQWGGGGGGQCQIQCRRAKPHPREAYNWYSYPAHACIGSGGGRRTFVVSFHNHRRGPGR